jgi:hypothetical protein
VIRHDKAEVWVSIAAADGDADEKRWKEEGKESEG